MELSSGYRFWHDKQVSAILDKNGTLSLKDDCGGLEVWENWRYYVRDLLKLTPTKGDESKILDQLGETLGQYQQISTVIAKGKSQDLSLISNGTGESMVDKQAKKAAPKAKKVAKSASNGNGVELNDCTCGCGGKTKGTFCPGHDSR